MDSRDNEVIVGDSLRNTKPKSLETPAPHDVNENGDYQENGKMRNDNSTTRDVYYEKDSDKTPDYQECDDDGNDELNGGIDANELEEQNETEGDVYSVNSELVEIALDENLTDLENVEVLSSHYQIPNILIKSLFDLNHKKGKPYMNPAKMKNKIENVEEENTSKFILNLESEIIKFIIRPSIDSWKMNPLNSYYRLLAHQLAEYYHLGHILSNDGSSMVLFKINTSLINADDETKKNAKFDQAGNIKPLDFRNIKFDPKEKLDRVKLEDVYNTYSEFFKKHRNDYVHDNKDMINAFKKLRIMPRNVSSYNPTYDPYAQQLVSEDQKHYSNGYNYNKKHYNNFNRYQYAYYPQNGMYPPPGTPYGYLPISSPPSIGSPSTSAPYYYVPVIPPPTNAVDESATVEPRVEHEKLQSPSADGQKTANGSDDAERKEQKETHAEGATAPSTPVPIGVSPIIPSAAFSPNAPMYQYAYPAPPPPPPSGSSGQFYPIPPGQPPFMYYVNPSYGGNYRNSRRYYQNNNKYGHYNYNNGNGNYRKNQRNHGRRSYNQNTYNNNNGNQAVDEVTVDEAADKSKSMQEEQP
ncbi:RNA-binding suppressor of PAS kinase protein 1 [Pichia kudriavzevii]|uniref:RNA-binding suppressor of PAS kinase protein 1 n=1 Tax=Pichia kudriavzevii TaxID=4909 RepID=A0A1V2LPY3_PICKU|nr:RNA-binding suppressor of PAS kinase protein 1 [Pichia kudriavzevii]